ncbi:MAG: hypothetical protein RIB61_11990 [Roseicyclus sp.]
MGPFRNDGKETAIYGVNGEIRVILIGGRHNLAFDRRHAREVRTGGQDHAKANQAEHTSKVAHFFPQNQHLPMVFSMDHDTVPASPVNGAFEIFNKKARFPGPPVSFAGSDCFAFRARCGGLAL